MTEPQPIEFIRRTPGRLRLRAPQLHCERDARLARIAAADGILDVHLSKRTGSLLLEFDPSLIDEAGVLAVIADSPASRNRVQRSRRSRANTESIDRHGWQWAERAQTIRARPAVCLSALTDFSIIRNGKLI